MGSSYQDVNWGYHNDAPVTDEPVRLADLNQHLAKHGFQMVARNQDDPDWQYLIHWQNEAGNTITLAAPQFQAEGYLDELVYDLADIRDMLSHVDGADHLTGHEIKANRRAG